MAGKFDRSSEVTISSGEISCIIVTTNLELEESTMDTVFDVLKMVTVNHQGIEGAQIVVTDLEGKPNGLLTDLLRDTIGNMRLFIDMSEVDSAEDVLADLNECTPLPDDVLDEYAKILRERVMGLNFAPQKRMVEILVRV